MNLITRSTFSCQGCDRRQVGCHSTCKEYKEEKSKYNNKVEEIKKTKQYDSDAIGFLAISTYKHKRMPIPDRTKQVR